ncbi:MAG: cytochrome P450 [Proteobacteria bacterium]|nr:cytochrome P450 [Pseudomonadota bacterium]
MEINRQENPIRPQSLDEVQLADPEVLDCPFPTYEFLLKEAPVWQDPVTSLYIISKYEDIRNVLRDKETYSNWRPSNSYEHMTAQQRLAYHLFEEKGWVPGASLAARDDPEHKEMRAIFDQAFRASRIRELDTDVEALAYKLIDDWIDDGHCEFIKQFAVPLPLIIICQQMGAREEDTWRIKEWTDAWIKGGGVGLTDEEVIWCTEKEIEAQHYFQEVFEQLRKEPNETLLSDLVNTVIPEWGRTLTDNELHAEMMQDTFVGGSETTTNAIGAGMMLLARDPNLWDKLKSSPDRYLRTFCEEVVRLEGPTQGMARLVTKDVEIRGVKIPKGSMLCVRFGAANRDTDHFECPHDVDLERKNAGSHLTFSSGTHHCLGAPLARRELYWSFKVITEKLDEVWLAPGKNDLRHLPNYMLRIMKDLHIEFRKA